MGDMVSALQLLQEAAAKICKAKELIQNCTGSGVLAVGWGLVLVLLAFIVFTGARTKKSLLVIATFISWLPASWQRTPGYAHLPEVQLALLAPPPPHDIVELQQVEEVEEEAQVAGISRLGAHSSVIFQNNREGRSASMPAQPMRSRYPIARIPRS
jgi:hypothetical protein